MTNCQSVTSVEWLLPSLRLTFYPSTSCFDHHPYDLLLPEKVWRSEALLMGTRRYRMKEGAIIIVFFVVPIRSWICAWHFKIPDSFEQIFLKNHVGGIYKNFMWYCLLYQKSRMKVTYPPIHPPIEHLGDGCDLIF